MEIYKDTVSATDCYFVKVNARNIVRPTDMVVYKMWWDKRNGQWDIAHGIVSDEHFKSYEREAGGSFPVVGEIDLKRLIVDAVLDAVEQRESE